MTISITFADTLAPRIVNALANNFGYQPKVMQPGTTNLIDNPETKAAFARRMIKEFIFNNVRTFESNAASQAAAQSASQTTTTDLSGMTVA